MFRFTIRDVLRLTVVEMNCRPHPAGPFRAR